jgi:hypothetical protein
MRYCSPTGKEVATATCRLSRLAYAISVLFFFLIALAFAQAPTRAIEEFGLFGIWADDCKLVASSSNLYASFSVTSGGIIYLHNDFGPAYGDMLYRIVDAKRIGQFRISLRQLLTTDDEVALDNVILKSNDRIRVWSSRGADGSEYVQDGLIPAANDRETGWMERCDTRSASNLTLADNEQAEEARRHLRGPTTIGRFFGRQSRPSIRPWRWVSVSNPARETVCGAFAGRSRWSTWNSK